MLTEVPRAGWVCSQPQNMWAGRCFRQGFTGRKPQVIREKLEDASKKTGVDLVLGAVLVLILMTKKDFRDPPCVLLPGAILAQ